MVRNEETIVDIVAQPKIIKDRRYLILWLQLRLDYYISASLSIPRELETKNKSLERIIGKNLKSDRTTMKTAEV